MAASSHKISKTGGQPSRGRLRRVFRNDLGLRAGWRLLIYVSLFVMLIYFLASSLEHFIKPGSGVLADGLFELTGLLGAIGAALVMAMIEKHPMSTYGLPLGSAFRRLFWWGWLAGLIEVSVVVGLIAIFHGYSFGTLAERGGAALLYGLSWVMVFVVVSKKRDRSSACSVIRRVYLSWLCTTDACGGNRILVCRRSAVSDICGGAFTRPG
jgi:hypothetical protein